MALKRACGTLVHPTSFPTPFGIGDLGPSARDFIHFLVDTDQSLWQILPLTPTGYGNSPYASYSAFAGNHFLISPEVLKQKGLLSDEELRAAMLPAGVKVFYEEAFARKRKLFEIACGRFFEQKDESIQKKYAHFLKENKFWLDDYALFMACFEHNGQKPWNEWESGIAKRDKKAMTSWKKKLKPVVEFHQWVQFEFYQQWSDLKEFASANGIKIVGDIPIFVDHNSSDVWSNPKYFCVDASGNRTLVAGVPPDYFSETGQLWGNPLYKWNELEKDGFKWWIQRFEQMLKLVDYIRLDHFRGFDAFWEVKASEPTAINGRWVKGPGQKLFSAVKDALGELPIIAEDLGVLTNSVVALRDDNGFPGMKILQFAFADNAANSFLPHNYDTSNCVVYTGTHDNDTTVGWYTTGTDLEKHRAREYMRCDGSQIHWDMIRLGAMSNAAWLVVPMQDFLGLDGSHRMNLPGTVGENWEWRYTRHMLDSIDRGYIKHIVSVTDRNPRVEHKDANLMDIEPSEA